MTSGVRTIIFPVRDLTGTTSLFSALLGVPPQVDEPHYVQFNDAGQDIGLNPHGHSQGMTGPVAYWHVPDIRASLRALLDAGAQPDQGLQDVGGGKMIASVKDTDGNVIGLLQQP